MLFSKPRLAWCGSPTLSKSPPFSVWFWPPNKTSISSSGICLVSGTRNQTKKARQTLHVMKKKNDLLWGLLVRVSELTEGGDLTVRSWRRM